MKTLVSLITVALAAASSASVDEAQRPAPVAPTVASSLAEDIEDINTSIERAAEADEDWVLDPVRIAMNVVEQGPEAIEERRYLNLTFEAEDERPYECVVTVVTDGYPDESMRGEWCRFSMRRENDGFWRVSEFRHAWRCYRGRVDEAGATHRDDLERFTSDRCL